MLGSHHGVSVILGSSGVTEGIYRRHGQGCSKEYPKDTVSGLWKNIHESQQEVLGGISMRHSQRCLGDYPRNTSEVS